MVQSRRHDEEYGFAWLGAELLVHLRTDAPPVLSEDTRQAVDDPDAFEEVQRRAEQGGQVITVRLPPGRPPKVGDRMPVAFRSEYLHFFDLETGAALR